MPTIPCEATSGKISNEWSDAGKKHNIMSEFERKGRALVHEYKRVLEKVSQNGS